MRRRAWLGLVLLAAAAEARAQFGGRDSGGRGRREKGDAGKGGLREAPTLEVTLHELEEDLKLTDAQRAAWQSYADKVRALVADAARERRRARSTDQLDLMKRLDHLLDVERNRLAALEDIVDAAKALYKLLTPEQRIAADPRLANILSLPAAPAAPARG